MKNLLKLTKVFGSRRRKDSIFYILFIWFKISECKGCFRSALKGNIWRRKKSIETT